MMINSNLKQYEFNAALDSHYGVDNSFEKKDQYIFLKFRKKTKKGASKFKQWCGDFKFEPSHGGQNMRISFKSI